MTDAREIIARFFAEYHDRSRVDGCDMEDAEAIIEALAGYRILGPDEVTTLQRALAKAEDGAGTLPARDAVKLRPADWHAIGDLIRALGRKA